MVLEDHNALVLSISFSLAFYFRLEILTWKPCRVFRGPWCSLCSETRLAEAQTQLWTEICGWRTNIFVSLGVTVTASDAYLLDAAQRRHGRHVLFIHALDSSKDGFNLLRLAPRVQCNHLERKKKEV